MKRHGCLFILSAVIGLGFSKPSWANYSEVIPQAIYGEDHRTEVCDEPDAAVRSLFKGTMAMIPKDQLKLTASGDFSYNKLSFGEKYKLCDSERFLEQPIVADCSGFLINEDTLVTAGHCVNKISCKRNYWVFNYQMKSTQSLPDSILSENIYNCKEVIVREDKAKVDYAVIKLDRKVTGAAPLKMRINGEPQIGEELFVIGYPMGLPAKIAGGAKLRSWDKKKRFFFANLDVYGGNSGSPIINHRTLEVEGILVRGVEDFVDSTTGACKVSKNCPDNGCDGEEVTNINYVNKILSAQISN